LDKKLTSTKSKQYISKSYMQIKRAKTVAEYLSSACRTATLCRWEPSEALPPGPRPASICSMHSTVKTLSDLLHLHCGTASQIISGLKIASINSRVYANKKSKNSE
jgi:hypothetical protein